MRVSSLSVRLDSHASATMRTASYIGFLVMVAVAISAFVLFDQWWLRVVLVLFALVSGWYSLGLYSRASRVPLVA